MLKKKEAAEFIGLNHQSQSFILLINVKMPTNVGILTFLSRIKFMLSRVEPENSFITSGLDQTASYGSLITGDNVYHFA